MNKKLPIVVLISGNGSNLQAIIDAQQQHKLDVSIQAVISNNADAYGLERAQQAGIATEVISHQDFNNRKDFDLKLQQIIDSYAPELILLAGFMRRLGTGFVQHFAGRVINIHPSLLPKYPGLNSHQKVVEAQDKEHGASIHFVTDDLDAGPIISQARLSVDPQDTAATLKARVLVLEHQLYPQAVQLFAEKRVKLQNGHVLLDDKPLLPTGYQLKSN